VLALVTELGATLINVVSRSLGGPGFTGALALAHISLGVLAFVGSALAYHFGFAPVVMFLVQRLTQFRQMVVSAVVHYLVIVVSGLLVVYTVPVMQAYGSATIIELGVPRFVDTLPLPVGATLTALFAIAKITSIPRHVALRAAAIAGAIVVVGVVGAQLLTGTLISPAFSAAVLFGVFFGALLLGLSIGYSLALSALVFVYIGDFGDLSIVPRQLADSATSSFVLLAVPFFIWAGLLMADGGPSARLASLIYAITGHFRGGALQAVIYAMYLFSGISGSKMADMAMMGTMLRDAAERQGYDRSDTAGLLVASAIMGETIPPSILMLLLGSVTTLSVGGRFSARTLATSALYGLPALGLPALLVWGILRGVATPTEVSSFAVVYALVLVFFVYRSISARAFWRIAEQTVAMTGMILLIVASAGAFAWAMATQRVTATIVTAITTTGDHIWVFWIVSMLAMVALGLLMEGGPALVIFGPVLIPVAGAVGVNELQFGICLIMAFGLGFFAPPFGAGIYLTNVITGVPAGQVSRKLLPYWVALMAGLALVAAVPALSLALPHALGLPGA
jgi:TRAP-type C4-dicarboxylate transport system permease large subunit/TRAP-type C4-dicarboxylate transport system permease small subunit